MESSKPSPAANAARKLEELFVKLPEEEQKTISEMVRLALLQAAEQHTSATAKIPHFVDGITGHNAPKLVAALRLPGSLAAHSIPGCNASALAALKGMKP
jgi:hypothetical protein